MLMCCYSDRAVSAISYEDFVFPLLCASSTSVILDILLPFPLSFLYFSFLLCLPLSQHENTRVYVLGKRAEMGKRTKILDCLSNIFLLVLVTKQIMHGI